MDAKEKRGRYLAKNTLIFTLGNIGSKLISFLLIPLYTKCLSTGEYGTVDLITTIATVAVPMLTLDIGESIMRFGLDKNANRDENTQIGFLIFLLSTILTLALCLILNNFLSFSKYSWYIFFYMVSLAACQIYQGDLRGKELLLQYAIASILLTFLTALLNILFLLVLHFGIGGYLSAYTIADFMVAIYCLFVGKGYRTIGFQLVKKDHFREMVNYSFALVPNTFMWWITDSSDRILVTSLLGSAANGIYAISYKLPTIVSTVASVFNQAWLYSAVKVENEDDKTDYNNKTLKALTGWSVIVGLFVLMITKPFLKVMVAQSYYTSWKYTPFLIIGVVYMTLGTFMSTSYMVHKDSIGFLISAMFGAIINIVLNLTLIRPFKIYGSALATCVSYISVFLFRYFHIRKYLKYSILNMEFIFGSLLLLLSTMIMYTNLTDFICFLTQLFIFFLALLSFKRDWVPLVQVILKKII